MTAIKLSSTMTDALFQKLVKTAALGNSANDLLTLLKRMRNADLYTVEVALGQAALASAGKVAVWTPANQTQTIKIRGLLLSGAGTAFSGGSGNRNIAITDGTSTWSVITSTILGTPAATRWGDAGVPFPATAAHLLTACVAGSPSAASVYAQYNGGTADYTAGALTLLVTYEIVTE
jgi:hypothetical protein